MKTLNQQQVEFYRREGYLHVPGALSREALSLAEHILHDWSERQIAQWLEQGLLDDARVDLVWDPPWTTDMMSEGAKLELGMM